MTIKDKLSIAPQWQQKRFKGVLERLEGIEITDRELQTLLWLSGFEMESVNNIINLILKAKNE